jgi:uncharacterized protein involved in outer membrane biogenesis
MKRALRWIIGIVASLLLLCITLFLFRDVLLREFIEHRIQRETGVDASIGSLHLDLFAPSVRVADFTLHNPPGFGERPMLHIPELYIHVDRDMGSDGAGSPGSATTNGDSGPHASGLRLHQATLNIAEFNIVRSADGRTNIFALEKRLRSKKKKPGSDSKDSDIEFRGIGELKITLGTVRYIDLQKPEKSQEFRIGIQDEVVTTIKNEKDLETWATALLLRIAIQQALEKSQEKRGNLLDLLSPKK